MTEAPKPTPVMFKRPGTPYPNADRRWMWAIGDMEFCLIDREGEELWPCEVRLLASWTGAPIVIAYAEDVESVIRKTERRCIAAAKSFARLVEAMQEGSTP